MFTNEYEFHKRYSEEEFKPVSFDFDVYAQIVGEEGFDGLIVDVDGCCFPIDKNFLAQIQFEPISIEDDFEGYDSKKLKEIFENVTNDSLIDFIQNDENQGNFEELMVHLSSSALINLVVSKYPLEEYAKDDIISSDDAGGFSLCSIENGNRSFGAIFTDKDSAVNAISQDGLNYYAQITSVNDLFEFILRNDMDGVIINPFGDDYLIPRKEILPQASGMELVISNPSFKNSLKYAFLI